MSNKSRFPFGGSNRDDEDDDEDKGKTPSSGSRPGSPFNRAGSPNRPDDKKKDDKPGGFGSRSPFGRRDDDDEDDEDEQDSRPAKPGSGRPSPFSASRPSSGKSASDDSDDDEDFEDDEEEEDERPAARSAFGGNRPGSGGKPNEPSKSGGAFGAKPGGGSQFGGNKPNEPAKPGGAFGAKPGGGSQFGGNKPNEQAKSSPFGGNKPNDPARPGGSSQFGGNKPNEPAKSGGAFGAKPGGGSQFGGNKPNEQAKPGGSSPFGGSKSNEPAKPSPFNASRTNEPAKPGGSSSSPFGSKPSSPFGSRPADKDKDKEDDKPSGGGFRSPFGAKPGDKPADKKDDKATGGGFRSPFGAKPGDKPADKKDDKSSGGGFRSPFGAKPGDKPADKKDDKATGGGFRSPFGAKPADKKDDKPAGGLGGFRSPFGAKPGDKPADKKDDRAATKTDDKPSGGGLFGKLPFGAKSDDRSTSKTSGRPDDAKKPGPAIPARGGAVTTPPKSAGAADAKKAGSKVPPARGEKTARPLERDAKAVQFQVHSGLNLDQKLDLAGYALMFGGVLLLFSLLNPSEGSITKTLADIFGGLFGKWGTAAVMVTSFGIGLWLFIRHFTENPLVIQIERAAGYALMFVTFITTIHYIVMLSHPVASMAALFAESDKVIKVNFNGGALGNGGGWLGGQLYKALISAFGFSGDYILPVLLAGLWIASIYLTLALTMAEVSSYVKSIFHWFGRVRGSYVEHRRAAAEARAAAAPLTIESPVAATAGATPAAATLAAPGGKKSLPERAGAPRLAPAGATTGEKAEAAPAAAKSTPAPFGKPPAKPAATEVVEEVEEEEAIRPAAPARAAPGPFGARPEAAVANAPASTASLPTAGTSAPAKPTPKPGLFGARPAKPDEATADIDEDLDEVDVKPAAPIVKPSPLASAPASQAKPSQFGARPGASAPAKSDDKDKVDDEDELDDEKAEPAKPASPVGNRPSPFGSQASSGAKPGSSFGAKPGGASAAPAKLDDKDKVDDEDELDDEKAEPAKPASPVSNRPSPFGSPANSGTKPGSPFGAKPGGATAAPAKPDDKDKLDDEKAEPAKPAKPVGNRPSPFGSQASSAKPGSPFGNPFAKKPADEDKSADDELDELDEDEKAEPAKPAKPVGNRPSPFGSPPSATPRPVPKPGGSLATRPPLDGEDEEEGDDPKYVSVDELEDDGPPRGGPRPTVAGGVGTTPSAMPRPANPIAPKPRPGEEAGKPSAGSAGGGASASPFGQRPPSASAAPSTGTTTNPATTESASAPKPALGSAPAKPEGSQPQGQPSQVAPAAVKPAPPLEGVIVRSKPPQHGDLPDFHELLESGSDQKINEEVLKERARVIEDTLKAFSAPGKVIEINPGPVITQFGVEPDYLVTRQGKKIRVKVSQIAKLDADLALALAARSIRIEAPVPGKGYVGIEVPNAETALVSLRDIMDSEEFRKVNSKLRIGLGKSVDGAPIAADLTQMPHLLIAGTTGSGKSVCVNAIITCLLLENTPDDLKMVMVDPKRVELTGYNGIPHLVSPVVVDLERIVGVLKWVTREMEERYKKFAQAGARNINDFNSKLKPNEPRLPFLVVVIDELADLMMLAPEETERVLTRLAQMARATGIHLIISTQRPSVDVVTGLIKANFPARISFAVASSVDSRVILDQPGAEKLLGRGDMLFQSPDAAAPVRMQGVFVSDAAINRVTSFWKTGARPAAAPASALSSPVDFNRAADPVQSRSERFAPSNPSSPATTTFSASASTGTPASKPTTGSANGDGASEDDEMYEEALDLVRKAGKPSISLLQRRLRIGYTRAARLIELMEKRGAISPAEARNASGDVADEVEDPDKPEKA